MEELVFLEESSAIGVNAIAFCTFGPGRTCFIHRDGRFIFQIYQCFVFFAVTNR
jgi:hypothetical protein